MKKLFALLIGLSIGASIFAQKNKAVELNWKIGPQDTLSYLTVMKEVDLSSLKMFSNAFLKTFNDSSEAKALGLLKELNKSFEDIDLVTNLTNNRNGTVEIEVKARPKEGIKQKETDTTDSKAADILKMIQVMNQGIMLRGSIYETGGIHSFWVKSNQKNLIALFFELPTTPVKLGDSWGLDVNLISNDQNFQCDSSYKQNKVTLSDLRTTNKDIIAVLKYDIEEFVDGTFNSPPMLGSGGPTKTRMKFTYHAIAEFSVNKGRWISYEGLLGLKTGGIMTSNTEKKFSLIEE